MAVTFDATVGGASANSYVSITEANDYFAMRVNASAWSDASTSDKEKALMDATRRLDRINWAGSKSSTTQALEWPRTGVTLFGTTLDSDTIPGRIQDATCELALAILTGSADAGMPEGVDSFSLGAVKVSFAGGAGSGAFPALVDRLISPLRFSTRGSIELKRGA